MFTGIIEEVGALERLAGGEIAIRAEKVLEVGGRRTAGIRLLSSRVKKGVLFPNPAANLVGEIREGVSI